MTRFPILACSAPLFLLLLATASELAQGKDSWNFIRVNFPEYDRDTPPPGRGEREEGGSGGRFPEMHKWNSSKRSGRNLIDAINSLVNVIQGWTKSLSMPCCNWRLVWGWGKVLNVFRTILRFWEEKIRDTFRNNLLLHKDTWEYTVWSQ